MCLYLPARSFSLIVSVPLAGAAHGRTGGTSSSAKIDEVHEAEIKSLKAQEVKTKGEALKAFAECSEVPQELKDKAVSQWAKALGIE